MFKKIFLRTLFCLSGFFLAMILASGHVYAASEFSTSYLIRYTVKNNGQVEVEQNVKLTNRLANIYASEYTMTISSNNLDDVASWDENGPLDLKVEKLANKTIVNVFFKQKKVGKDKSQDFFLKYKSPDFAFIKGQVLEIGIPLMAQSDDIKSYQTILAVPQKFGQASYILPKPKSVTQDNQFFYYTFSQLGSDSLNSITATFGSQQIFDFNLKYHLSNQENGSRIAKIALPPDTETQTIAVSKLIPLPINVDIDADGNWIASYLLKKNEKLDVSASGSVKIVLRPKTASKARLLSSKEISSYTAPQKYWPADNPEIKKKAKELGSAQNIYNYLVNNFQYDYSRLDNNIERKGGLWALDNPQKAICMEFTDAFISLARAIGIPAREVNGYAYTSNSKLRPLSLKYDVLHAWPQFYDQQQNSWIQIDPTWGNTTGGLDFFNKLDLDHFVFSIRGLSSQHPFPAGTYKTEDNNGKDVEVVFGSNFDFDSKIDLSAKLAKNIIPGLPIKGSITITNYGPLAQKLTRATLVVNKNNQTINKQNYDIAALPPYGHQKIDFVQKTSFSLKGQAYQFSFDYDNNHLTSTVKENPQPLYALAVLPIFTLAVIIFITSLKKETKKR